MEQILKEVRGMAIFFNGIAVTIPDDAHVERLVQGFKRLYLFIMQ